MSDAPPFGPLSVPGIYGLGAEPPPPQHHFLLHWLAGAPLVPPAIGLAAGIFIDATVHPPFWLAALIFPAAGGLLFLARRSHALRHMAIVLAALALGAVLHDLNFRRWPADHIAQYRVDRPVLARLTGRVVQTPLILPARPTAMPWMRQSPRTRLLLDTEQIQGSAHPISTSGLVSVTIHEPLLGVGPGDRLQLFGYLHHPMPPSNPGERDRPLISRRNGVLVEMNCDYAANVTRLAGGTGPAHWLAAIRRRACAAMRDQTFDEDASGARLLDALVLGQRSAVDPDLNQAFVNTGTVHYLSVSGAHIGVLVMFVWLVGWALGLSRRGCTLIAAALVIAYAILTEPSPAITRATVMSCVFFVAILTRRPLCSRNNLAAAAFILLVMQPTQLFDAAFQLSFLTLLAVMTLGPQIYADGKWAFDKLLRRDDPLLQHPIQYMLNPPSRLRRFFDNSIHKCAVATAVSLAAWLTGACLASYHFRQAAPWGWLNTIIIAIPMSLVLLLGLLKTIASALCPPTAIVLGPLLERLTDALIGLVGLLNRLPGSGTSLPEVPAWLAAAGIGVLALWVALPSLRISRRWFVGTLAGFSVLATWSFWPHQRDDALRMEVLSVGHGLACVIQMPGGPTLIYDMGTSRSYDLHRTTVGPFLAHEHIRRVDVLALSHPHPDHCNGVPGLLDRAHLDELLTTPYFFQKLADSANDADQVFAAVQARNLPWRTIERGRQLARTGAATVEVLWPPPPSEFNIHDANDSSMVLRISYAGRRILLTGDVGAIPQQHLIISPNIAADVMILPHHGGVVRTTREFIAAVNPAYCIRSGGEPDSQTTNGLLDLLAGRRYFNTADCGAVEICITPGELTVRPFH